MLGARAGAGVVGAGELRLELEQDPCGTQVSILSFFLFVCFVCSSLHCKKKQEEEGDDNVATLTFFFLLWSCVTIAQCSEEGDDNNIVVAFFFFFFV